MDQGLFRLGLRGKLSWLSVLPASRCAWWLAEGVLGPVGNSFLLDWYEAHPKAELCGSVEEPFHHVFTFSGKVCFRGHCLDPTKILETFCEFQHL